MEVFCLGFVANHFDVVPARTNDMSVSHNGKPPPSSNCGCRQRGDNLSLRRGVRCGCMRMSRKYGLDDHARQVRVEQRIPRPGAPNWPQSTIMSRVFLATATGSHAIGGR